MFELSPLLIPIFALAIPIVAIWTRHQQKMAEMGAAAPSAHDNALLAAHSDKIARLEDRVKVLERIVTDGSHGSALASEIEALRGDGGVPLAIEKERV